MSYPQQQATRLSNTRKPRVTEEYLIDISDQLKDGWRPDLPVVPFLRIKLPLISDLQHRRDVALADIAKALSRAGVTYRTGKHWTARTLKSALAQARKPTRTPTSPEAHWLRPALQDTRDPAADDNARASGEQRPTTFASMPTIPEAGSISETQAPAPPKPTQPQPETETDLRRNQRAEDSDPKSWANPWTIPLPPIKFARKKIYPAIAADPPPVSAHDEAQPPGSSRPTRD